MHHLADVRGRSVSMVRAEATCDYHAFASEGLTRHDRVTLCLRFDCSSRDRSRRPLTVDIGGDR